MEINYRSGKPQELWKGGLQKVYLFFGEEDRLKEEAVRALRSHVVVEDFADFDAETLDAGSTGTDAILASAGQVCFGSERRFVLVKGMEQWRDRGKQGEVERLAEGIARLSEGVCLVLLASAEEDEDKRKTAVTVKLDNAVKKFGVVVAFHALKGDGLIDWIVKRVEAEGNSIDRVAAEQIVSAVGSEMLLLEHEIIKLVCFVGERQHISSRDVATVCATSPEDVMFATIDAIARRQTDRALTLLAEMHRYDPNAQGVAARFLALLSRHYRMLWQAKFLAEKRINPRDVRNLPAELSGELPTESNIAQLAFKATDLFTQSKGYRWSELTAAMEQLLLCDLANKGGVTEESDIYGSDPEGNLKVLAVSLVSRE